MTAIITDRYRIGQARLAYNRLLNSSDLYYLGIGRAIAWDSESSPDTPDVDPQDDRDARLALQSIKKIANFTPAVPRYTWTSGNSYDQWDDADPDLSTKQFYVYNSSNQSVYVCLKKGSSTSTTEPTSTGSGVPTAGADGYIWKFLYTIDATSSNKYLTTEYIPVLRDTTVAAAAVQGAIHNLKIVSGGVGYSSAPTIAIQGDGSGATATCTVSSGAINTITVTAVGSGYTYARCVLSGGSPSTAGELRPIIAPVSIGREIDSITVDTAGTGYTNGTKTLVLTGDGYNGDVDITVTANAYVNGSEVINAAGYGYTQCTAASPESTTGTAAAFTVNFSSSKGGFGYDPVVDLNARYIMFNVELDGAEGSGDFFINQDFRQIVIVKNPLDLTSGGQKAFSASTGFAVNYLDVEVGGTWVVDDIIEGGSSSAQAYIVYYDSGTERVYISQDVTTGFGAFTSGEALAAIGSGTSAGDVASGGQTNDAEFDKFSGELLYLENRVAVTRATGQSEDIKITVKY